MKMNYSRGKPRGIQRLKEKAYAASREESDPTRLKHFVQTNQQVARDERGK